mgnify:CR=1 FL=1
MIVGEVIDRSEVRVSRALVNFAMDMLLLLLSVVLSLVSVIVQFVFPPGVSAKGWHLWGLNFGQWCGLQFGLLSVLGFGIVVHVMLHWTWICSVLARQILGQRDVPDNGLRTVYGVALLIGLLMTGAIFIGLAMISIQMPPQG